MKISSAISVVACVLVFACSSSSTSDNKNASSTSTDSATPNLPSDSGLLLDSDAGTLNVSSGQDAGQDVAMPVVPTLASCVADCERKYPKATNLNKQLDATCFLGGECESVCNDLKPGKLYTPTEADGGGCDTVSADSYPITTTSQACSDCLNTTPVCCSLWIAIFGSTEGRALNACTNDCYTKYSK